MKKILVIMLAGAMAFSMVACGNNNQKEEVENVDTVISETVNDNETEKENKPVSTEREEGREERVDNPNGSYTINVYDKNDVLMLATRYFEDNSVDSITKYDEKGFIVSVEKNHPTLGHVLTEYENSETGNPIKSTMYKDEKGGMVVVSSTDYEYYESGRTKSMTTYDVENNKISYVEYHDNDAVSLAASISYNKDGSVATEEYFDVDGTQIVPEK